MIPANPSLYVHIPFCASRCGYCTFASGVYDSHTADAYLAALENEFRSTTLFDATRIPETIFIGGGTPSTLSIPQLRRLFSFLPPSNGEFTCEVNPDTAAKEKLRFLRDHGVNRVSFGVQTFDPDGLKLLGRLHDAKTAEKAIASALSLGFASVSIDLINGWPGQDENCLRNDLIISCNYEIQHISSYTLIIDSSAERYAQYRALLGGDMVGEETAKRSWEIIEEFLETKGFKHYETSNFCRPGFSCRHNVLTWEGGEYLGLGLSAASHIGGTRYSNTDDLEKYIQCSNNPDTAVVFREHLPPEEKARECAVFWLRLFDGIDLAAYREKTGYDFFALYKDVVPWLLEEGILQADGVRVRVARAYQPVLDGVLEYLI